MDKTELRRKMDELCNKQGETCAGCPCQDFDVCNNAEEDLTDGDYVKGIEALESLKKNKVGKSIGDGAKTLLHATHEPTQGSEYDVVSKPKHYASTSIECIDAMRETQGDEAVKDFCVCNAFKYLWRHNSKNGDEDIRKASWYLNKAVEIMDKMEEEIREKFCPSPTVENFVKVLNKTKHEYVVKANDEKDGSK